MLWIKKSQKGGRDKGSIGPRAMKPKAQTGHRKMHHPVEAGLSKSRFATQDKKVDGGYQCGKDQPDADVAVLPQGFCFQHRSSPECPKAKRVLPPKSERRESPEGSLNATTREETDPGP